MKIYGCAVGESQYKKYTKQENEKEDSNALRNKMIRISGEVHQGHRNQVGSSMVLYREFTTCKNSNAQARGESGRVAQADPPSAEWFAAPPFKFHWSSYSVHRAVCAHARACVHTHTPLYWGDSSISHSKNWCRKRGCDNKMVLRIPAAVATASLLIQFFLLCASLVFILQLCFDMGGAEWARTRQSGEATPRIQKPKSFWFLKVEWRFSKLPCSVLMPYVKDRTAVRRWRWEGARWGSCRSSWWVRMLPALLSCPRQPTSPPESAVLNQAHQLSKLPLVLWRQVMLSTV